MAWGSYNTDFSKTIDEAAKITRRYFSDKKRYQENALEVSKNYKGDLLREKLAEQKAPDKALAISGLHAVRDLALGELDIEKSMLHSAKNLSPDWAFLSLPVTLPVEFLEQIHARNANDKLLCLGLQQYCKNRDINALAADIDFTCFADAQRGILEKFFESEESTIQRENLSDFQWAEAGGYYDNVKAKLENYESYQTYETAEPTPVRIVEDTDEGAAPAGEE